MFAERRILSFFFYSAESSARQGKTVPRTPLIVSHRPARQHSSSAGAVVVGAVVVVVSGGRVVGSVVGSVVVGAVVGTVVVISVVATTGCSFIGIWTLIAERTPIP